MAGKIALDITKLLEESGATPLDLARFGVSPTTAYNLAHGKAKGVYFDVLQKICDFFTERLGREIDPGDIVIYQRD